MNAIYLIFNTEHLTVNLINIYKLHGNPDMFPEVEHGQIADKLNLKILFNYVENN